MVTLSKQIPVIGKQTNKYNVVLVNGIKIANTWTQRNSKFDDY